MMPTLSGGTTGRSSEILEKPFAAVSVQPGTLFKEVKTAASGMTSENNYADPAMWGRAFHEFEIGAIGTGVAIGDFDGDGKPDVFVVSKTESCRLFRNLGNYTFEDVTAKAGLLDTGVAAQVWKQGAAFVDINNDGRLDLYLCRFGAPNRLYINSGDGTFSEQAARYHLDVSDASVMAYFADYDRDGWLDLYLVTNLLDAEHAALGRRDYLFHNNHDGTFSDVSAQAGINGPGQGHSAAWWDYNDDGWPDLYVANDFEGQDKLYRNNGDGTFTDVITATVPHMPLSSMGCDTADLNNDGFIDLMVADMAATTHEKDQRGMASSRTHTKVDSIACPQLPRNSLYINTGTSRFQEAAFLTGLAATDWTWSLRFEDFDNDGRVDLFVTNGMVREINNTDLLNKQMRRESSAERILVMKNSPFMRERNLAFRNLGNLSFANVSALWGLDKMGVSFGAATGDLGGTGNLDIIFSNYEEGVTLMRNNASDNHRIEVSLHGSRSNRFGVGSTIHLTTSSGSQVKQLWPTRGLLSSSEPMLHFGLGQDTEIKELRVHWPSGYIQSFYNLGVDRRFEITEPDDPALYTLASPKAVEAKPQFIEVSAKLGLDIEWLERNTDESESLRLMPFRPNHEGPELGLADFRGENASKLFMAGSGDAKGSVYHSTSDGRYKPIDVPILRQSGPFAILPQENGDCLLIAPRSDDNFATHSGGYALMNIPGDLAGVPGILAKTSINVPNAGGIIAAADFKREAQLGLFLGGAALHQEYPRANPSALLAFRDNNYIDVTDEVAPELRNIGLVTGALWSDVDQDGYPDLVLAIDWGNVRVLHNERGLHFTDWTEKLGFRQAGTGRWQHIASADFNGDGRPDFVVGNLGLNTPYQTRPNAPEKLYVYDFKGDGEGTQLIETECEDGKYYPRRNRRDLSTILPSLQKRFPTNDGFAKATVQEVASSELLQKADVYTATEYRAGVFLSQSDGNYIFQPLPRIAQLSPTQDLATGDFDGDGFADVYIVQNTCAPIAEIGPEDGGQSQLLAGDGHGNFQAVTPRSSGLIVEGFAGTLVTTDLNNDGWADFIVSRYNDTLLAFQNQGVPGHSSVRLQFSDSGAVGAKVSALYSDHHRETYEVSAGSHGKSTLSCFFGYSAANRIQQFSISWPNGRQTSLGAGFPLPPVLRVTAPLTTSPH